MSLFRENSYPSYRLIPRSCSDTKLKHVIKSLNGDKFEIQRLRQHSKGSSRPNTLSSRYGLGAFPIHSDFALSEVPPKFIILAAPRPRFADTLLFEPAELIQVFGLDWLKRSLYLLRCRNSKYCRLLTLTDGKFIFRYNKEIMVPQNNEAREVSEYIDKGMKLLCRINWIDHRVAIINNWNLWHARDLSHSTEFRSLFRVAVWGGRDELVI